MKRRLYMIFFDISKSDKKENILTDNRINKLFNNENIPFTTDIKGW